MTMFNWNSQPGEPLVSPYIWAYFAAMVPLTLLVVAIWCEDSVHGWLGRSIRCRLHLGCDIFILFLGRLNGCRLMYCGLRDT